MEAKLKENGWFLSSEGIAECERACSKEKPSLQELSRAALNLDLKQYGVKHLPDEINKGKVPTVSGPMVLQVQKLRNISAPKANEESNHAPRLLKIQLTDGHLTCHALESSSIPELSLSIPPGTKVCLTGTITVQESFLMLDSKNTKVLGGEVEKLKEKWELNKTLAKHSRLTVSGDGPPPFVPFGQGVQSASENKGRAAENSKVNGVVQSSADKPKSTQSREANTPPVKSKASDNGRSNRPVNHEQKEGVVRKPPNQPRDERTDSKRVNTERANNRHTAEGRTSSNNPREKETRPFNSETANHYRPRQGSQADDDRQNSRTEQNEKTERVNARGQPLRTHDSNRGGSRVRGRGGRREPLGRGRPESEGGDDMEDYRPRQPSEPELWDFLSTKFPTVKDTKSQRQQKSTENQKTEETQQERPPPRPPPYKQESDIQKPKQHIKQDSKIEKTENIPPQRQLQGDAQGDYATPREIEKPRPEATSQSHHRDGRQQAKQQREQHYKQQPHPGQAKGKGSRRHDHDSRSYNQSLPPRLQKKQQQQQQQRQQHHQQHHHQHYQHHSPQQEAEVNSDDVEAEYSGAVSPPSVAQEDEAIVRFSSVPVPPEYVQEQAQSQIPQQVQFQELQGSSYAGQQYAAQGKWQKNYRNGSEQFKPQSFTPTNIQRQQQQHLQFVSMAMESQRAQTQFVTSQPQQFVDQGAREQAEIGIPQDYQYTQQTQPPVQAYPVYQLRPAQMAQQPMAAQPTMPQQPVATQMPTTQVGWKKGDHCLALWRDGQYYSAKMEELLTDGVSCMVSFLDFHNSCDVVPLSSLRPFPIIAWGEGGTVQPQQTAAVATVPYYAQPTPVSMVSRPQVVIPVSGQPPFHAVTRPTIVHSTPVPAQVHWQPAQMQYQEVRPAAFQPVMHYGAVPQTSSGGPAQAAYGVPTGAGVHYVRGVKDTQAQDHVYSSNPDGGRGRSSPNSSGYSKPRRPNRATQSYYVPPRQPKFKDKG